jgi:hypothetical protein
LAPRLSEVDDTRGLETLVMTADEWRRFYV